MFYFQTKSPVFQSLAPTLVSNSFHKEAEMHDMFYFQTKSPVFQSLAPTLVSNSPKPLLISSVESDNRGVQMLLNLVDCFYPQKLFRHTCGIRYPSTPYPCQHFPSPSLVKRSAMGTQLGCNHSPIPICNSSTHTPWPLPFTPCHTLTLLSDDIRGVRDGYLPGMQSLANADQ